MVQEEIRLSRTVYGNIQELKAPGQGKTSNRKRYKGSRVGDPTFKL